MAAQNTNVISNPPVITHEERAKQSVLSKPTKQSLVPKLRFKEFEGEWTQKQLGEVTDYVKGFAFKSEDYRTDGVRIIRVSDISKDTIKSDNNQVFIDPTRSKEFVKYMIRKKNIIVTTVGSPQNLGDSAVGRAIFINEKDYGLLNQNMLKFLVKKNFENDFLKGYLNSKKYKSYIHSISRGNANQANITVKELLQYELWVPALPEQQKIAAFLAAVDQKIQQLTQKKALLEDYKKGVMQQLFSGELRFKIKNEVGELVEPPDWEEKRLGEVLDQQVREVKKPSSNYLAIGIRSHVKGTFQKPDSDPKKNSMEKLFVVKENDLVVNITFAWEGAIAIAKPEDEGGLVSHRFPTYTFKAKYTNPEYFKQVILDKKFRLNLDLISPGGAGRNRVLSKKEFVKIKWSFPSLSEQQKIASYLSSIDTKIEQVNQQLNQTQTFKKGLLQQMFV
ncbi:restriction endonuclease subunit S [Maribacter polysaccharolyticus]|uniref:restriction endonuclease subunit S n=1 Tax=Maribacter polysaccharolyticus TaxID=3020831 RepID=UPI00237F20BF|nr:restriction endonuclease subunit S [Maribacter polysaccharolyticus]MDE3743459.1 restriction endonuclease subunit S [Maribacter polysaccharolyticus]